MWHRACAVALLCAALAHTHAFKRAETKQESQVPKQAMPPPITCTTTQDFYTTLDARFAPTPEHPQEMLTLQCVLSSARQGWEVSASPFVLSTRYGRSPPRMMTPRTDRFFMNGRYGKRSDPLAVFDISEKVHNEKDTGWERDSDILHKWRPRCDCAPYGKIFAFNNYKKRTPEVMDQTVYED